MKLPPPKQNTASSLFFAREVAYRLLRVALEAPAHEGFFACQRRAGGIPEDIAFMDVGHMHLDGGEADGFERVENGDAGVGVCGKFRQTIFCAAA
jgi:hypothetical protein